MKKLFNGVCVALVTPFVSNKIDYKALDKIIDRCVAGGVKAFVVAGTTGEPCSLSSDERRDLITYCIHYIGSRAKVIVGVGSNNIDVAISNCKQACTLHADGVLAVTPYYNKTTQRGIVEYYRRIALSSNVPVIAYNVPSRTGVNILPETLDILISNGYISGLKEASGDIVHIQRCFKINAGRIPIYSGDDSLNYLFYCLGGVGSISVTANLVPKLVTEVYDNISVNRDLSLEIHNRLIDINKLLFVEVNPIPIKYALSYIELCRNELRLPLVKLSKGNQYKLRKAIVDLERYN